MEKIIFDNPWVGDQVTNQSIFQAKIENLGPANYESLRNAIAKACAQWNNDTSLFALMDLHSGLKPQAYAEDVLGVQIYLRANRDIWSVLEKTLDGLRGGL